jgi:dTDP-4-dehydrorhamnose 3,5-epimerase-like enzyme
VFVHEDDRRKLHELPPGDYKVCKAIVAKSGCVLGSHYHAKKTESFMLVVGTARRVIIGNEQWDYLPAPQEWVVPPGTYHLFDLEPGSVLVGTATELFDPKDEIAGNPVDIETALS